MTTKKTLFITAGAALIIAIGGYGIAWNSHANAVVSALKNQPSSEVKLSYDAVRTEGFPFTVRTILTNATIDMDAGTLYKEKAKKHYHKHALTKKGDPAFTKWQEKLNFPGELVLSQNPLSQATTVSYTEGTVSHNSTIDDTIFTSDLSATELSLFFDRPKVDFQRLFSALGNDIIPETGDTPAVSGTISGNADAIILSVKNIKTESHIEQAAWNISGKHKHTKADISAKKTLFSADVGKAYRTHYALLSAPSITAPHPLMHLQYKQTAPSDIAVSLEIDGTPKDKTLVTLSLNYAHPDISAKLVNTRGFREKDMVDTMISGEFEANKQWYHTVKGELGRYFSIYMKDKKNWDELKDLPLFEDGKIFGNYKDQPEKFAGIMAQNTYRLVPKLHTFGKTKFSIEQIGFKQPDGTLTPETFVSFLFDTDLYRISAAPDKTDPQRLQLTMTKHDQIVKDFTAYTKRSLAAWEKLTPDATSIQINDGFDDALALMLESLGTRKANDLTLDITQKPPIIYIGSRSLTEISGEAMLLLSPYITFDIKK